MCSVKHNVAIFYVYIYSWALKKSSIDVLEKKGRFLGRKEWIGDKLHTPTTQRKLHVSIFSTQLFLAVDHSKCSWIGS
jgi:hypothetical protein